MSYATLATCTLNQWALDFSGNLARIRQSIIEAKAKGATYRVGPELEVSGYGCEDHFLEPDTYTHSWEVIAELVKDPSLHGILIDVGAPVIHRHVAYNCRIFLLNGAITLIRPKTDLADDGNYREARWFRAWPRYRKKEEYVLPSFVRDVTKTRYRFCWIGLGILEDDSGFTIASELCEELWTPNSPHISYSHAGVHIISNASASHHSLRKLSDRMNLLRAATSKTGGVYMYANAVGCDGSRIYYDGSSFIALNGALLAQSAQFSMQEVHVLTVTVDLERVLAYRTGLASRGAQSAAYGDERTSSDGFERIRMDFELSQPTTDEKVASNAIPLFSYVPEEEIARGPACWLWDYLRRSGMNGFFLPLSGGADSAAVATIVFSMCTMVVAAVKSGDKDVLSDVCRIVGDDSYSVTDPEDLCGKILHTAYLGSKGQSSGSTKNRAHNLCKEIGAWHTAVDISPVVKAFLLVLNSAFPGTRKPKFKAFGGSYTENMALQNLQARTRMVLTYLFAQLRLWATGRNGGLLVLGAGNVDEGLSGYLTKYDCSSADLNPIGGISKVDLKRFLLWASNPETLGIKSLKNIVKAPPTAELEPLTGKNQQNDETDMGMTYSELGWYGRLRKLEHCGPVSMFRRLVHQWVWLTPAEVADKVKHFFTRYSRQRHKMTTLTPSYHAENYGPDDNRYDLRQFLYSAWDWQFKVIDKVVQKNSE